MAKKTNLRELETLIAAIEKRRLNIEQKRTVFQFEIAFFIPLFALLFIITYFSESSAVKMFFFILTIILIVVDLVYSITIYKDITDKQNKLEELIHQKLGDAF